MATRHYRAGIAGDTGRGGYGHGLDLACQGIPEIEVLAVADPDPDGRAAAARRVSAARSYATWEEMLDREALDLLVIATGWVSLHPPMLLAAAERGIHVYCEKPFLRTPAEADQVLRVAARTGARIAVAHQARAVPIIRQLQAMIDGGAIGRLRGMRGYGKCDPRAGGQDLLWLGQHVLDLMRAFGGEVAWVQAHVTVDGRDAGPADVREGTQGVGLIAGNAVRAYFAYRSGIGGTFESAMLTPSGGSYLSLLLEGTAGLISLRSFGDQNVYRYPRPVVLPGLGDEWERIIPDEPVPTTESVHHFGNRVLLRDLLEAAQTGREPLSSGADALATLELVMAIYDAHRIGGRVPLPLQAREHALARLAATS